MHTTLTSPRGDERGKAVKVKNRQGGAGRNYTACRFLLVLALTARGCKPLNEMMEKPEKRQGAVVLRTIWGDIAAERNFSRPLEELLNDKEWKEAVGLIGGPFCYMPHELDIPF